MIVVKNVEPWARGHQQRWHAEALQMYGERVVVRHRWNVRDYALGRVGRCTSCSAGVRMNETQRIRIADASNGTFTLTFSGQTTPSLQWDASRSEVQEALENLEVNEVGDILVAGESISDPGLTIEFRGQWAYRENIPNMTYNSSLTPGSSIEMLQLQEGTGGALVQARAAAVYKQAGDTWCQECYGIGFEGGFEPIVYVTWALVTDSQNDTTKTKTGVMQRETPSAQFSFMPMLEEFDLVARVETWEDDNITPREVHGRYILGEVMPTTIRTGPGTPDDTISTMPAEFRTRYQIPKNEWVVGQRCDLEIVPWVNTLNNVPLTRFEERLVEAGEELRRRWHERADVETPFDARQT